MHPSDRTYYHGTFSGRAVEALLDGGGLEPLRPVGRSRFAAAASGLSYLSPCFRQAAEYGMMQGRADWPDAHDFPMTERSYVFAFDLSMVACAVPEEDELGWAVLHAVKTRAGLCNVQWTQNVDFADALISAPHVLSALADEAHAVLGPIARLRGLLEKPAANWSGAVQSAVGRCLAAGIDPDIGQILLDMGISIGVRASPGAVGAWSFDRRRLRGFMDAPEKADPEPGPWLTAPAWRPSV